VHSGYRCPHCGHEFSSSMLAELVSPHGSGNGGWKYVRCPRCDRKSRAKILVRET
jgi:DNA-directed RNA polymerase subunit RPC12/RpoP